MTLIRAMPQKRQKEDFSIKMISPKIVGKPVSTTGPTTAFDMVEQMQYLYVRVVKARALPPACDPFVEVKIGNYKATTLHLEKHPYPKWNVVFALSRDRIQATSVDILVKDKAAIAVEGGHKTIGRFVFNVSDAPNRVPPDSPLAPQWYRVMDQDRITGELMLAFWIGTQADEVFPNAYHADTAAVISSDGVSDTPSKVYNSPRLWYLRVSAIQAQDLLLFREWNNRKQPPELFVQASLGKWICRTSNSKIMSANLSWNEDLMFVAAEPFDKVALVVTVVEEVNNGEASLTMGRCEILLKDVERRNTPAPASAKWYNIERPDVGKSKEMKYAGKIQMRISLDGGYHVQDEPTHSESDCRPTAKILWKPPIGVLELGILSASGLLPMKPKNQVDAYCVAKYGPKWVRTRTIVDTCDPKWNQQCTWEVYDPCTFITVAVFENRHLHSWDKAEGAIDSPIGKVKIRLSTLQYGKIYTGSHPLVVMQPSGVQKMGEIQLVLRLSCYSMSNVLSTYVRTPQPRMHYIHPLSVDQKRILLQQTVSAIKWGLSKAEPPLREEVVDYMLDVRRHIWSHRRARVNYDRILKLLDGPIRAIKWYHQMREWTNLESNVIVAVAFLVLFFCPSWIVPGIFFYLTMRGFGGYGKGPKPIPHIDTELCRAYTTVLDDLDEEFDSFPTRMSYQVLMRRYDRLRHIAWQSLEKLPGDIATLGERVESLLSWRDPRATAMVVIFCLSAAIVTTIICYFGQCYRVTVALAAMYVLFPPRFRSKLPQAPYNFLKRMPDKTDILL